MTSITGTAGVDSLTGGNTSDTIDGVAGNDIVYGGGLSDVAYGGTGNDELRGDEMLVNPGLEAGYAANSNTYSGLTGWTNAAGTFEVWGTGLQGTFAFEGTNFIELDNITGGTLDSLYQNVSTTAGQSYVLSFAGLQRSLGGADDRIQVYWRGTLIDTVLPGSTSTWSTYSYTVTGSGGSDRLEFRELSADNDSHGPFLDGISLTASYTDSLFGGAGDDTLYGGGDTLFGGSENDTLTGGDGADSLDGGDHTDTLYGGLGNDIIETGEDLTIGDDDIAYGGDGDDTITEVETDAGSNDQLFGGAGTDSLLANAGTDSLFGGSGADTLNAGTGDDSIQGGDDADVIFLSDSFGADSIDGGGFGTDSDTLNLSALTTGATVTLTSTEVGSAAAGGSTASFTNIEQFVLSNQGDTFTGTAAALAVSVDAGAGADSLTGGAGGDTLTGGSGADTFDGGVGTDTMYGGDDQDLFNLTDTAGADTIYGGSTGTDIDTMSWSTLTTSISVTLVGNEQGWVSGGAFYDIESFVLSAQGDTFNGTNGRTASVTTGTTVDGGAGNDTLFMTFGGDTVFGGTGADKIEGQEGADKLYGGDGDDTIVGYDAIGIAGGNFGVTADDGSGDSLYGGLGDDTIAAGSGADSIDGGDGNDTIWAGAGSDTAEGGLGLDSIDSGDGNDLVYGGLGADTLGGGAGADTLDGGDDADRITGGAGADRMSGGACSDIFVLADGSGIDRVTDFSLGTLAAPLDQFDVSALTDASGNPVDWRDVTVSDDGFGNTVLTFPNGESVTLTGVAPGAFGAANSTPRVQAMRAASIPCFTPGALILTPAGEVPVESLRPGDRVTTMDNGPQRIVWTGRRDLRDAPEDFRPILIPAGALANRRSLLVSPQHAMLIRKGGEEGLVRARHLADQGRNGIRIARGRKHVSYIHLLFEAHQIIFAKNAPTESFHPGPQGLKAFGHQARTELLSLFPDLAHKPELLGPRARPLLRRKDLYGMRATVPA